jgi:hypothetical protein
MLLMAAIVTITIAAWEIYLRKNGHVVSYDNNAALWADKRNMVYEPSKNAMVFIGSSRIKYDLDISTWQNTTGVHAIQLGMQGSSPRSVLDNLADDQNFKGRLIIDVTDFIFFSNAPFFNKEPIKFLKHFKNQTLSERASFYLNKPLESNLVFLDNKNVSLNAELDALQIPSRPGVFMMPTFPIDFDFGTFDRQSFMANSFVENVERQNQVKAIWQFLGKGASLAPPMPDNELTEIFESVKNATNKIKSRCGEVIFIRTPSSGGLLKNENKGYPKEKYWDRLLQVTNCQGIHFMDYPEMNHFICPEFSHLTPKDATTYTKSLMRILEQEKGWELNNRIE